MTRHDRPNPLARALRRFFADHMPRTRGLSPHTILSYRDAVVDLETKRAALAKAGPVVDDDLALASWRSDASILTWIEAL